MYPKGDRGAVVLRVKRSEVVSVGGEIEIFLSNRHRTNEASLVIVAPKTIKITRRFYNDKPKVAPKDSG